MTLWQCLLVETWDHIARVVLGLPENYFWSKSPIYIYLCGFKFQPKTALLLYKILKLAVFWYTHEGNSKVSSRTCRAKWLWLKLHCWASHRRFLLHGPSPSNCYNHWLVSNNILLPKLYGKGNKLSFQW